MATLDGFGRDFDPLALDPGEGGENYIPTVIVAGSTRPFRPAPAPQFIDAHHGARSRAEARDRRIRDEDLALDGRPRLNAGNCQAMMQNEWGWW